MPRLCLSVLLLCCALCGSGQTAEGDAEIQSGWRELSRLNPVPAEKLFASVHSREARLGAALATFTIQPHTSARREEAQRLLADLIEEIPTTPTASPRPITARGCPPREVHQRIR